MFTFIGRGFTATFLVWLFGCLLVIQLMLIECYVNNVCHCEPQSYHTSLETHDQLFHSPGFSFSACNIWFMLHIPSSLVYTGQRVSSTKSQFLLTVVLAMVDELESSQMWSILYHKRQNFQGGKYSWISWLYTLSYHKCFPANLRPCWLVSEYTSILLWRFSH